MKFKNISSWVGLIAPIYYFGLMETLGRMWPGYNSVVHHMSELGGVESPFKNVMNIFGFMGVGLMIIVFGLGFYQRFKHNLFLKIASICMLLAGLFMIIVGFFPCDAHCIDVTLIGRLHTITSIPQSIFLPLGVIIAGFGFNSEKQWGEKWKIVSMILGWGSMAVGPLMSVPKLYPMIGLVQRIGIGLSLLWMMLVSKKMLIELSKS